MDEEGEYMESIPGRERERERERKGERKQENIDSHGYIGTRLRNRDRFTLYDDVTVLFTGFNR